MSTATVTAPAARPAGAARPAPRRPAAARYWPGLDGLRAVAVAAVVAYHLDPGALPGGWIGVDLFFVISGYLITTLLADERRRRGAIDLVRFWIRRVRRLYPAVVVLLAVVVPVAAAVDPAALARTRLAVPMSLVYLTNWWFILHRVPYFQRFGPPSLLIHLWSLAIEEQYYLLWPPLLVLLLRRWHRYRVAAIAAAGALASGVWMAVLYSGPASVNRVYFGTDTHAEGLLLGSALALLVPPTGFASTIPEQARRILDRVAAVAAAGLVAAAVGLQQSSALTWRGGLVLTVVVAGLLVVVAAHPATRTSAALSARPLRWLGTRSYSVYLWHWPIIVLTDPIHGGAGVAVGRLVLRLAATAAAAEGSYRLVEQPWRTGRAVRRLAELRARSAAWRRAVPTAVGGMVAVVTALLVVVPAPVDPAAAGPTSTSAAALSVGAVRLADHRPPAPLPPPDSMRLLGGHGPVPSVTPSPAGLPSVASGSSSPGGAPGPVLAIGDSVMLAAAGDLQADLGPQATVDAVVGRQVSDGLARLAAYRAAGKLQGLSALVVGLGTNGPMTSDDLSQLLALASGVPKVVLVNVRVPDSWQSTTNAALAAVAHRPGVEVVDWYDASAAPGLLWPDQVHPDPAGQAVYAQLVEAAVDSPAG